VKKSIILWSILLAVGVTLHIFLSSNVITNILPATPTAALVARNILVNLSHLGLPLAIISGVVLAAIAIRRER